jgi:transposase
MTEEESEVTRLKKELGDMCMERNILKKAVGTFSKSDGKSFNS